MRIKTIARRGGGAANIISGNGSPQGVVSTTGPAFYFDTSNPNEPVMWIKPTAGTSNNQWYQHSSFSN